MSKIFIFMFFFLSAVPALADTCTARVTRTCQPGQPCRSSETRTQILRTPQECLQFSKSLCPVYFNEAVIQKKVQASLDGSILQGGANVCQP